MSIEQDIGYNFNNSSLLLTAFSHSSYINEQAGAGSQSNERLEFLGDAVLSLCVADMLFNRFPDIEEGRLTLMRARLVCTNSLAERARTIGVGDRLLLSKGADLQGLRENDTLLENAFEAIVGAIYLDGGFDAAYEFVRKMYAGDMDSISFVGDDFKSKLQTLLQKNGEVNIQYRVVNETGPAHDKVFDVSVLLGDSPLGTGSGKTKKAAEQEAARAALCTMESVQA